MTESRKTVLVAVAAFLWSFVGFLAGVVLALALGFEGRPIVFFAAVGVAVGWFGFSGSRISIDSLSVRQGENGDSLPNKVGQEQLSPDEARAWLDDFLVKQQKK
jgi:hypothetical protein